MEALVRVFLRNKWRWVAVVVALQPVLAWAQEAQELEKARQEFTSFKAAFQREAGSTWGRPLYGPVLLVDPMSRRLIANVTDSAGQLRSQAGVYTGLLLASVNTANTALRWVAGAGRWCCGR